MRFNSAEISLYTAYLPLCEPRSTLQLILRPAIIKGLGYSNVNAQLLTVPVYFVGAVSFILIARLSDHQKVRSPYIALSFCFMILGEPPRPSKSSSQAMEYSLESTV